MSQSTSIISLANALYAPPGPQKSEKDVDDRLDAARALLGVSPSSVAESTNGPTSPFGGRGDPTKQSSSATTENDFTETRSRSNSVGLDALAFCATNEQVVSVEKSTPPTQAVVKPLVFPAPACLSSSDEDSESMPPPPPRTVTRRRSVSNPEGMERWAPKSQRLHLVLPASILEEELAEANAAMKAKEEDEMDTMTENNKDPEILAVKQEEESKDEEEFLDEDELLRRARSRLLEDLSQGNLNGDKGVLTLPHSLEKYKEVYNKNGRIGIYTPAERAAIISRFQSKRTRRVWNKKIRYNCRKNLADRRMRVKGRFVKRSTEDQAKSTTTSTTNDVIPEGEEATFITPDGSSADESTSANNNGGDQEMPDVTDPDAGFCPTDDQPYRRLRRHTIT